MLRSEILDRVYGVRTLVSPSVATGSLTVTVIPWRFAGNGVRVHMIGGAGSAVNLTRELYRLGYSLSGGIAHEHDSDEKLWRNLGIECASRWARFPASGTPRWRRRHRWRKTPMSPFSARFRSVPATWET